MMNPTKLKIPLIVNAQKNPNFSIGLKKVNETLTKLSIMAKIPIISIINPDIINQFLFMRILKFCQN